MMRPSILPRQIKTPFDCKILAAILSIAAFFFAYSQPLLASSDTLLEQLADCANISNSGLRLHCYDGIVEINSSDSDAIKQLPQTTEAKSVAFEKQLQNPAQLGEKYLEKKTSNKRDQAAVLRLKTAYKNKRKLWVFEFTNGQVWRQLEPRYIKVPKDSGATVTISQGIFGSHNLKIGSDGITIKVKRLK